MEHSYPDIKRLPIGKRTNGKKYLSQEDAKYLLDGRVLVEEKMDGKPVVFYSKKYQIWAEDLKVKHSVYYEVPGRYVIFDIMDLRKGVLVDRSRKEEIVMNLREEAPEVFANNNSLFFIVPLVGRGEFELIELPKLIGLSAYALDKDTGEKTFMEGIVIKQDRELFLFEDVISGKVVRKEFEDGIEENYWKKPLEMNIIDPKISIVIQY